jgi:hypothetical protein
MRINTDTSLCPNVRAVLINRSGIDKDEVIVHVRSWWFVFAFHRPLMMSMPRIRSYKSNVVTIVIHKTGAKMFPGCATIFAPGISPYLHCCPVVVSHAEYPYS